ncbi:MAG: hypothetical protein Q4F29_07110 [Lachnospiraceae bacterium]|nr:hypothetical protein [Lachnospiraceae bacterium]
MEQEDVKMTDDWGRWMEIKRNPYFQVTVRDGRYETENPVSYYRTKLPDATFSFDVSNQKVQANLDEFGTVKNLTFFHGNYRMESKPGVWVGKDFVQEHNLSVSIERNGRRTALADNRGHVESDLAGNRYPRSIHYLDDCRVGLLTAAPVTGEKSFSCLMQCVAVTNTSEGCLTGAVQLPPLYVKKYSDTRNVLIGSKNGINQREIPFCLKPGETAYGAVLFADPDQYPDFERIQEKGISEWLDRTEEYFRSSIGSLQLESDPMAGLLFERAYMQAYGAFAMSGEGDILGSNWGTFPVTPHIWNKDMYYSALPSAILNPDWCRKCILWFDRYGIKYKGTKFEGGIFHSLSNSLSVILLSGAYYDASGDQSFYRNHPELYRRMKKILKTVLDSRKNEEPHLYRTIWISDAYALGTYHTGTNLCVWRSLMALARIGREIFDESEYAESLEKEAKLVKSDIERYMTVDGTWGRQYLEGIWMPEAGMDSQEWMPVEVYQKEILDQGLQFLTDVTENGKICLRMHDGEESDTTLMGYYGYQDFNSQSLHNYGCFAASSENPTYSPLSRGIKWGNQSGATFPGYLSVLLSASDQKSWSGENGRFKELERLADLDGSWWWWPYRVGAETGDVVRMNSCGKCGWASGIFVTLCITGFFGIRYDGRQRTLFVKPVSYIGSFKWEGLRYGNGVFDLEYCTGEETSGKSPEVSLKITNKNDVSIHIEAEVQSKKQHREAAPGKEIFFSWRMDEIQTERQKTSREGGNRT